MEYDIVLMNPPYQSGLHLRFLAKALEMLKPDGICISLQPTAWHKYTTNEEHELIKSIVALEDIPMWSANKQFKDAIMTSNLGIYTCMKCQKKIQTLSLSEEMKKRILEEHDAAKEESKKLLSDKVRASLFSQYFTEPALSMKMLEKLDNLQDKDIIDIAAGSGNLLAAAIIAGADPKRCYGIELDKRIRDFAAYRLSKLGVPEENIKQGNAIANYDDVAVYVTLLPCKCTVKYLAFPDVVFSLHSIDLSYSIGKELLQFILQNAVDEKQQIIFNESTTLANKFAGSLCIDKSEIYQLAKKNQLHSFEDLKNHLSN